jgi:hypothetical protein
MPAPIYNATCDDLQPLYAACAAFVKVYEANITNTSVLQGTDITQLPSKIIDISFAMNNLPSADYFVNPGRKAYMMTDGLLVNISGKLYLNGAFSASYNTLKFTMGNSSNSSPTRIDASA